MSATTYKTKTRWSDIIDASPPSEESAFKFLVPKNATYYRSKAFVSQTGINPLIAASAPLFFLIEKIQTLSTAPNIEKLYNDLVHEINSFEQQATTHGYRSYIVLAARYVLCLWIDRTILNAPWEKDTHWENISFVDHSKTDNKENEPNSNERATQFFMLLTRCLQEPSVYIDLLELFYLCLSLGFVDTLFPSKQDHLKMTEARDYLFEVIHREREKNSKRLEIDTQTKETHKHFSASSLIRPIILIVSIAILTVSYFILGEHLDSPVSHIITSPL